MSFSVSQLPAQGVAPARKPMFFPKTKAMDAFIGTIKAINSEITRTDPTLIPAKAEGFKLRITNAISLLKSSVDLDEKRILMVFCKLTQTSGLETSSIEKLSSGHFKSPAKKLARGTFVDQLGQAGAYAFITVSSELNPELRFVDIHTNLIARKTEEPSYGSVFPGIPTGCFNPSAFATVPPLYPSVYPSFADPRPPMSFATAPPFQPAEAAPAPAPTSSPVLPGLISPLESIDPVLLAAGKVIGSNVATTGAATRKAIGLMTQEIHVSDAKRAVEETEAARKEGMSKLQDQERKTAKALRGLVDAIGGSGSYSDTEE